MNDNNLFPTAAPDFTDPLGLLRACHERILTHCSLLLQIAERIQAEGVDDEVRQAAAKVHRYFSTAGRHHHADEEEDLFPRLARQSLKLADLVHQLRQEHEAIDTLWGSIEPLLARPANISDTAAFADQAKALAEAYQAHVAKENDDLLVFAQHIFGSDELKKIGAAMAKRRGVKLPGQF